MSDNKHDDDEFHTWHISELAQCGSERYIKNNDVSVYSESFKILYEQEQKEGSDEFVRIYGKDEGSPKSQQEIEDDEFHPFKTGITRFDERMSGKGGGRQTEDRSDDIKRKADHAISDGTQQYENVNANTNSTEHDHPDSVDTNNTASAAEAADTTERDRMRIFEDAYRSGFEEGKTKGYEDGLARGMEEGFQSGHEKGAQEGYDAGFQKGEQEGYDAGFQKGEEDGKVVSDAKALEIITSLEDILNKAEHSWQNTIRTHESKILSMICKIAEKVVFARVELDEGIVKESILNALATMPEPEEITLNISPDDYEYVEMIKDDFFERVNSLKTVSVISNPSVQRGGCKIESSKGKVETDIKTRLEQVFTSVMGARVS